MHTCVLFLVEWNFCTWMREFKLISLGFHLLCYADSRSPHLFLMSFLNPMLILGNSLHPDVLPGGFVQPFNGNFGIEVLTA